MPKVKVKLNRLEDVDVEWVSLVKRGANQIPFRILKSQDIQEVGGMDFFKQLLSKKSATEKNSIVGVVIKPTAKTDLGKVEAALKEKGFTTEHKEQVEDYVIYKQGESRGDDVTFEIKDGVYVSVGGVYKAFEPFVTSDSFSENLRQGGFFPNLSIATEVLRETIANAMFFSTEKPTEKVSAAIDEFKQFIMTMLAEVPETAFKLADLDLMENESEADETKSKGEDDMNAEEVKAVVKESVNDFMTTEQEQVLSKVTGKLDDVTKQIEKQTQTILGKVEAVSTEVETLKKENASLKENIEAVSKEFTEYKEQLSGILNIGSMDDDPEADDDDKGKDPAKKSADEVEDVWGDSALDIFDAEYAG